MRLTTAAQLTPPPGQLLHCIPVPVTQARPLPDTPPSFNQVNHALARGDTGGWLCVTLRMPEQVDRAALQAAFRGLLSRHETLRTRVDLTTGTPTTVSFGTEIDCYVRESSLPDDPSARHAQLLALIDATTHSTTGPNLFGAAIEEPQGTYIVLAVDHGIADAVSMPLLGRDFVQLYGASLRHSSLDPSGAGLPPVGSFLDACRVEAADHTDPDDPRIAEWHDVFRRNSGGLPRFPLPEAARRSDGIAAIELRHTLTAAQTSAVERWARAHDARLPACLLAVCAHAVHRVGLGDEFATLLPVGTRSRADWAEAVGWFVSNGPVLIPGDLPLERSVIHAQQQVERAQLLAAMRLGDVIALYAPGFTHTGDVGMVSYVDYRRIPGHELHAALRMTQASPDAPTTDVQLWWVRDAAGLALRCRLPDTAGARRIVGDWLDQIERSLRQLAD
ncbi:MAG TPA: condensation domain-containing protein [Flexivirga sp.]|uniref:condensation domain-containing protein n=1 Tax=Flexivirga sp. TaxID=1962927 RepID=UPI002C769C57|nr:condensation domain-containing protein [Flexivirga sp.]HWC22131.1 condensation domain-containing protein [Flexivirga sp.]